MTRLPRTGTLYFFTLALVLTGCHGNATQSPSSTQDQSQGQDPASANLAPISTAAESPTGAPAPQQTNVSYSDQSAPPPDQSQQYSGDQAYNDPAYDDQSYDDQSAAAAPQPPPPLPEYDQPECPGDDYIWTPGYWSYAPDGYYWVPGAWVQPPYVGALWTPGYWGYVGGGYRLHRGYWGPHVGFYGGINYGFGYVGFGYQGGYWNNGHFDYNRAVNRVDVNRTHYVYNRTVVYNNTYNTRVSYNGGSGGINVRPRPAEVAAFREQHAPPMTAQVQHAQQARGDRANFAAVNHGRPQNPVIARPLSADHNIRPPAMAPRNNVQQFPQRQQEQQRPNAPGPRTKAPWLRAAIGRLRAAVFGRGALHRRHA
jgi:hypothetical protein